jgi:hypothetical protein
MGDISTHTDVPVGRDNGRGADVEVGEFRESCEFPHGSEVTYGLLSTVYVDSQLSEVRAQVCEEMEDLEVEQRWIELRGVQVE